MTNVQTLVQNQLRQNVPDLRAGQIIRVHEKIKEGQKERIQVFEGLVMAVRHGKGLNGTFTVRKIGANNIGVERIYPLHLPTIQKIEILRQEKVRRAKLNYVRGQLNKKTKKRVAQLRGDIYDFAVVEPSSASPSQNASEEHAEATEGQGEEVPEAESQETPQEAEENKKEQATTEEENKESNNTSQESSNKAEDSSKDTGGEEAPQEQPQE